MAIPTITVLCLALPRQVNELIITNTITCSSNSNFGKHCSGGVTLFRTGADLRLGLFDHSEIPASEQRTTRNIEPVPNSIVQKGHCSAVLLETPTVR